MYITLPCPDKCSMSLRYSWTKHRVGIPLNSERFLKISTRSRVRTYNSKIETRLEVWGGHPITRYPGIIGKYIAIDLCYYFPMIFPSKVVENTN